MLEAQRRTSLFAVRDTGIGIAAADLPHIFERFWRADRARSRDVERGGFGLGLAISQWIAQAHGGSITVQSRLHGHDVYSVAAGRSVTRVAIGERVEPTADEPAPVNRGRSVRRCA